MMKEYPYWIDEQEVKAYIFFHVHFFGKNQKINTWILDQLRRFSVYDNHSIVELGCGTGNLCFALSNYFENVIGVDSSKKMLEIGKKRLKTTNKEICFYEEDMISFSRYYGVKSVFTASFVHLQGEKLKYQLLLNISKFSDVKYLYIYMPEIIANPNVVLAGEEIICDVPCRYAIKSYTDFKEQRHYAHYNFLFQKKEYTFRYCFEYLLEKDMANFEENTGWKLENVLINPKLRCEPRKNITVREKIYVFTK